MLSKDESPVELGAIQTKPLRRRSIGKLHRGTEGEGREAPALRNHQNLGCKKKVAIVLSGCSVGTQNRCDRGCRDLVNRKKILNRPLNLELNDFSQTHIDADDSKAC